MTTERLCGDCGEPITEDDVPTVHDDPGLCDRCSAEAALPPATRADVRRRRRWIAVAAGLRGATIALIGVTIARKRGGADQIWTGHGALNGNDADDLDDEFDDLDRELDDDFDDLCEACEDKPWIDYCPECHRVDD